MQHWAREGIAGRGVLIDYASWAAARGIAYSAFSQHVVTMEEIRCIAEEEGVKWQEGDILFVRMGVVGEWEGWTRERKEAYARSERPMHAGVEATEEVLSWLWREGFAAVAGDALSWEVSTCCIHTLWREGVDVLLPLGHLIYSPLSSCCPLLIYLHNSLCPAPRFL